MEAVEAFLLLERPELVAASAKSLAHRHHELFIVDRDAATGTVSGVRDGRRRSYQLSAMTPATRRIAVRETEDGLESLAVFIGHGGQMLGPSSWYQVRRAAWERMCQRADHPASPLMPPRRWRWHDLRHTYAVQLLSYLEQQLDGHEPDAVVRRCQHMAYLGGHIKHNPLLRVSARRAVQGPTVLEEPDVLDTPAGVEALGLNPDQGPVAGVMVERLPP